MTLAVPLVLGSAWGAVVAAPIVRRAARVRVRGRVRGLRPPSVRSSRAPGVGRAASAAIRRLDRAGLGSAVRVVRAIRSRRALRHDEVVIGRELPVTIDLLGVAVGAGCTPYLAVEATARWAPPNLGARLDRVRRDCSLGASFEGALDALAVATPSVQPLTDALLASDRYGAPVATALGRLAAEEASSLRRRAEARARTVPVRLLFPLVFLVLPAFGLLTVVPALLTGFAKP